MLIHVFELLDELWSRVDGRRLHRLFIHAKLLCVVDCDHVFILKMASLIYPCSIKELVQHVCTVTSTWHSVVDKKA